VPSVTLDDRECELDGLPMLCVVCGRPADVARPKLFLWRPAWSVLLLWPGALGFLCVTANAGAAIVGIVPSLVCLFVPIVLTRSQRVWTPLCPAHVEYWVVRAWFLWGGALATVGSLAGTIVVQLTTRGPGPPWLRDSQVVLAIATAAWLTALAVLHSVSVRTDRIAEGWIELLDIHADFAQALARRREAAAWQNALDADRRESRPV
jgi:hypothetical protein